MFPLFLYVFIIAKDEFVVKYTESITFGNQLNAEQEFRVQRPFPRG